MNTTIHKNIDNFQKVLIKIIGTELYNIRKNKGISGSKLGKKLKISQQQISRYERGLCSMSCEKLFSILFYLEISPVIFFENIIFNLNTYSPDMLLYIHDGKGLIKNDSDFNYLLNGNIGSVLNSIFPK
ncbi:fimbrial operon regulator [Providencia sneebia DSM 19967]|uniref:Fimbrial operon regulator n=2 Tax=Providencia sneebia TaxID=516075 RepID=K8WLT3_9GAMM|nr:fimbrial operon regulator [Providencia sneebia DSM 19967]